jgi:hypothetical protein
MRGATRSSSRGAPSTFDRPGGGPFHLLKVADMAPKPLRQVTRKSAAALPTTQTAKFLFKSAHEATETCPQLAAVLGRRCLQVRTLDFRAGALYRSSADRRLAPSRRPPAASTAP